MPAPELISRAFACIPLPHIEAEERLQESEKRFRALAETIENYAIFMLDAEGRVASWNVGAQRIQGYTAEEIVGRHLACFFPEKAVKEGQPERFLQIAAAQGSSEAQGWRVRKDGSVFWAHGGRA